MAHKLLPLESSGWLGLMHLATVRYDVASYPGLSFPAFSVAWDEASKISLAC